MTGSFRIESSSLTHVGHVRVENEDGYLSRSTDGLWIVADGMGGHANGRFASQTIVEMAERIELPPDIVTACDVLAEAVQAANAIIYERGIEAESTIGSTFVSLIISRREFAVMWAGDSRAYVYRHGELILLTRDHTQVQELQDRGALTEDEAREHPMKHVLARAVGVSPELEIDAIRDDVDSRDIFLLCSDGLHGLLLDDEIAAILDRKGPYAADDLIAACLERGAPDNVTVTLVEAREPTLLILNGEQA